VVDDDNDMRDVSFWDKAYAFLSRIIFLYPSVLFDLKSEVSFFAILMALRAFENRVGTRKSLNLSY